MKHHTRPSVPVCGRPRKAFTLTELLIVITIISMLASMSLVVATSVQRSAQISATEVNIARLDLVVTELYESYLYRRIDVPGVSGVRDPRELARIRLHFIHDTMRMEMPCNWHEALSGPQPYRGNTSLKVQDSPLRKTYEDAFVQAVLRLKGEDGEKFDFPRNGGFIDFEQLLDDEEVTVVRTHAPAKLLYLIVMNAVPDSRDMIHERHVATGGDGLSYFVDAWGEPIYFLRWAPGFSGSDRQPDLWKWTGTVPDQADNVDYWTENLSPDVLKDEYFTDFYETYNKTTEVDGKLIYPTEADRLDKIFPDPQDKHRYIFQTVLEQPDPLDVMRVRRSATDNTAARSRPGWLLVPLIYSAGPDGEYGIGILDDAADEDDAKRIVVDPFVCGYGAPHDTGGGHFDNIHNHIVGGR